MGILANIVNDLEKNGALIRIKECIDPNQVIAIVQLKAYEEQERAILFENVKGSNYPVLCNLFGTIERSKYLFRKNWKYVQEAISLRNNPSLAIKNPFLYLNTGLKAINSLPKKVKWDSSLFDEIKIEDLPQVISWPNDGGAFITLPQVYSEDLEKPGVMNSNLGMYRVQISGNEYITNEEIGLHYQIHRGIGVHHTTANNHNQPLKVSIFIGGHPAHTLSAVMPLPEGLSELVFAGLLAGRRFRYSYDDEGHAVSMDADFVITGYIESDITKPEGPFGDHLGYYSLVHHFPVMKVRKVYARKDNPIFPITVVGRPPQEDTSFGNIIHELTGEAIQKELPGVSEVHAVDTAGVHPLLFALGSERYTPYDNIKRPAELLTQANRILGTGQLSLAKFLFITAPLPGEKISTYDEQAFLNYLLERVDWRTNLHFQTQTTIDTLDYSGERINEGSKVICAVYGAKVRNLSSEQIDYFDNENFKIKSIVPGILAVQSPAFVNYSNVAIESQALSEKLVNHFGANIGDRFPLIIWCDDASFVAAKYSNFLWVAFTRANPSHDIHGIDSFINNKHWGCNSSLIIDARIKPHHSPALIPDPEAMAQAELIIQKYFK